MHSINSKPPREEAYTTLTVRPPDVLGHGLTLRLKVAGNAASTSKTSSKMSSTNSWNKVDYEK